MLLLLLQVAREGPAQLLRPAPTHLPCQAEYLTVAHAIHLRRVLASILGRPVMLRDCLHLFGPVIVGHNCGQRSWRG